MDRQQAKQMGEEIKSALRTIAEKHNMTLEYRGGTFSDTDYKPRATFTGKGADGKSREEKEWELYYKMLGLEKEWLGEVVTLSNGKDVIITGLDMKKTKFPVMAEDDNGGGWKLTPEQIQLKLRGKIL